MALVVFLRGVNVGGHRTFRPAALARELEHLGAVNVGAAGTFVVRKPVAVAALRAELVRRLPFETEIMISPGREIARLAARDFFAEHPESGDLVRFVSVLAKSPSAAPAAPFDLPANGPWRLRVLAREGRYVVGVYRRQMKAIATLGTLDRVFGVPVTTRNWNTLSTLARILADRAG